MSPLDRRDQGPPGRRQACADRIPAFADAGLRTWVNGPIPFSPDAEPLMGRTEDLDNLYHCCGFSAGIAAAGGAGPAVAGGVAGGDPGPEPCAVAVRRVGRPHRVLAGGRRGADGDRFCAGSGWAGLWRRRPGRGDAQRLAGAGLGCNRLREHFHARRRDGVQTETNRATGRGNYGILGIRGLHRHADADILQWYGDASRIRDFD